MRGYSIEAECYYDDCSSRFGGQPPRRDDFWLHKSVIFWTKFLFSLGLLLRGSDCIRAVPIESSASIMRHSIQMSNLHSHIPDWHWHRHWKSLAIDIIGRFMPGSAAIVATREFSPKISAIDWYYYLFSSTFIVCFFPELLLAITSKEMHTKFVHVMQCCYRVMECNA